MRWRRGRVFRCSWVLSFRFNGQTDLVLDLGKAVFVAVDDITDERVFPCRTAPIFIALAGQVVGDVPECLTRLT